MYRSFYENIPMSFIDVLLSIKEKTLSGGSLAREEALVLSSATGPDVFELFSAANSIRSRFRGGRVDLCSIVNAKSGACPEDCAYCAQSRDAKEPVETYALRGSEYVLKMAEGAKKSGAKRFCIVTSGRSPRDGELESIADMIRGVRALGLLPCATLGLLEADELRVLKDAGLERYHHNLETSRSYFPKMCGTHTYDDKLRTVRAAKAAGLSVCSGGIFGLGEAWADRVDMALEIKELDVDSVPINFLMPIKGTKLADVKPLSPLEALMVISIYRLIMPDKEIRVCGGRPQTLGEFNSMVFMAGADGLLIGNYLTAEGRRPEEDMKLIEAYGLKAD